MASAYDLTNERGLSTYLNSQSVAHTSVVLLTGGYSNYVYRVTLISGETRIYKHAAPYLQSNASFAFDPSRMDYEDLVLRTLPGELHDHISYSPVRIVSLNSYNLPEKLLCLSDAGDKSLKEAYTNLALNIQTIGSQLGQWLATLHTSSANMSLSLSGSHDPQANNPIAVSIYRYPYRGLATALSRYGYDVTLAERIDAQFEDLLATDNECLCHGDFWPGNVLVKPATQDDNKGVELTVVDWEMTRRGTSALDVAQFCAEAFLLDRFRGGRGLLHAFRDAYLAQRRKAANAEDVKGIDREWLRRFVVHWAVHVAFWPTRVQWANREATREIVGIAVGLLRAVVEGDWEAVCESVVLSGMDGVV